MRWRNWWLVAVIVGTVCAGGLAWSSVCPLGVPGEWVWTRRGASEPVWLTLLVAGLAATGYFGYVSLAARRAERAHAVEWGLWLAGLVCAATGWLWVVQEAAPPWFQLSKNAWVLYFRGSSGYFSEAREHAGNPRDYLSRYEARMAEGDVLHIGTHPPGLVVGYWWLDGLLRRVPVFERALLAMQPASVRENFAELQTSALARGAPLTEHDRAVLWGAGLFVLAVAGGTVFPLYRLLRGWTSRSASLWTAALWPTVPAVAVFCPKSDVLFPCLALCLVLAWRRATRHGSVWVGGLAGGMLFVALTLSLAFLPVVVMLGLYTALRLRGERAAAVAEPDRSAIPLGHVCRAAASAAVVFVAMWGLARGVAEIDLVRVWLWNYKNHAGFYGQYPRTYWMWTLVNPLELGVAIGLPVAVSVVSAVRELARERGGPRGVSPGYRDFLLASAVTWGVLHLSGKNMGEAARLWIFLMPWALAWLPVALGHRVASATEPAEPEPASAETQCAAWPILLACQLAAQIAIVTRIVGFHIPAE